MKSIKHICIALCGIILISSCEKKDYPAGKHEYDHHYYHVFIPNNNTKVTVNRTQATLLKLPVQFYSTFTRSYDAASSYAIVNTGIAAPAVLGQDYQIVDKNGATITPVDGKYPIVYPQAVQKTDTIYLKMLNSAVAGVRSLEVQLSITQTEQYVVDVFSTAFRRPIEIR